MPEFKMYGIGNLHARFNSFNGLIPVKPIRKIIHTNFFGNVQEYIRVRVLQNISGFKKDEILELKSHNIIPLKQIKKSKYSNMKTKILGNYCWLDLFPEINKDPNYAGKV